MGLINVSLFCSSRRLGIPGCLRGRERKNGGCIKSVEGYRFEKRGDSSPLESIREDVSKGKKAL